MDINAITKPPDVNIAPMMAARSLAPVKIAGAMLKCHMSRRNDGWDSATATKPITTAVHDARLGLPEAGMSELPRFCRIALLRSSAFCRMQRRYRLALRGVPMQASLNRALLAVRAFRPRSRGTSNGGSFLASIDGVHCDSRRLIELALDFIVATLCRRLR